MQTDDAMGDVALFVDGAPEGFAWIAGRPEVQTGYGHALLGRLELRLDPGQCLPTKAGALSQAPVFSKLREQAHYFGANAVIYIQTYALNEGASDCERLKSANIKTGGAGATQPPWASGFLVRLEPPQAEIHGVADGGLSDPGFDRDGAVSREASQPDGGPPLAPLAPPAPPEPQSRPEANGRAAEPRSAIGTATPSFVPTAPPSIAPASPQQIARKSRPGVVELGQGRKVLRYCMRAW